MNSEPSQSRSDAGPPFRAREVAVFIMLGTGVALPWFMAADRIPWWLGAATLALGLVLAVLSAIDIETQRLPDMMTLPLIAAGMALPVLIDRDAIWWHASGAVLGYLVVWSVGRVYTAMRGRPGIGLGDAKLLAAAGAWLGPAGLPSVLLVATFGALAGIGVARWRGAKISARSAIPFGPFLALGFWAIWLYGPIP